MRNIKWTQLNGAKNHVIRLLGSYMNWTIFTLGMCCVQHSPLLSVPCFQRWFWAERSARPSSSLPVRCWRCSTWCPSFRNRETIFSRSTFCRVAVNLLTDCVALSNSTRAIWNFVHKRAPINRAQELALLWTKLK